MSPTDKKIKLWIPSKDLPRAKRTLIVASYAGVELEIPQMTWGESNKTPEFLKKNPMGRVPVLELQDGTSLFESLAILRYLATKDTKHHLLGRNDWETAQVDQWLAFTGTTLDPPANTWLYPILGYRDFDESLHQWAVAEMKRVFEALNRWFETRTFLVAERLTLADLTLAATLVPLYKAVLDPRFRAPYVNVNRWFETITQQEKFRAIYSIDPNAWCTVAQKAQKKPAGKQAAAAEKTEEKKEEKKPEPKKAAKKKDAEDDDEEEEEAPAPKPKNELDLLPKSNFALDEFKREFSNKPLDEALEFFYKNFDAAGYTLWYSKYKYNDELSKIFMSTNLINGMYQRMESMRKYAFGVNSVFGEDGKNEISGFWVFRGTGDTLPKSQLDVDDSAHYDWTQIKWENIDAEKARIRAYLNGDDIDGKPYADGKTFK
jgi:elongation factor 1-gamma